jgi:hypothetical protein
MRHMRESLDQPIVRSRKYLGLPREAREINIHVIYPSFSEENVAVMCMVAYLS